MKTVVHVDQHAVRRNRKRGTREPVLTVKTYKTTQRAHEVAIHGPSQVVYRPDNPLPCGAHCWVETQAVVEILGAAVVAPACPIRKPNRENKSQAKAGGGNGRRLARPAGA